VIVVALEPLEAVEPEPLEDAVPLVEAVEPEPLEPLEPSPGKVGSPAVRGRSCQTWLAHRYSVP
jgi:hypothetical protein